MTGTLCSRVLAASMAQDGPPAPRHPQLDETLLDGFHNGYGFPGATAAIALPDGSRNGRDGLADVEAATAMTPETRMLAASIGKSFVAATVLALETDGLLARTDPVAHYLGDRAWFAACRTTTR